MFVPISGIFLISIGCCIVLVGASWLTFHLYKTLENDTQPWLYSHYGMASRTFWAFLGVLCTCMVIHVGIAMVTERHDDYVNSDDGGTKRGFTLFCLYLGTGATIFCVVLSRVMCLETPSKMKQVTPLLLLLFVVITMGQVVVRRSAVKVGRGYNWEGSANVLSWRKLDDYSTLVSLEFSADDGAHVCAQDLYMECADYNWRYYGDDDSFRYWWMGVNDDIQSLIYSNTKFVCGEDMAYVDDDGWYAEATLILANTYSCSAAWRTENTYDEKFAWPTPWYAMWITASPILVACALAFGIYFFYLPRKKEKMYDDDDCSQCSSRSRTTTDLLKDKVLYSPPSIDLTEGSGNIIPRDVAEP